MLTISRRSGESFQIGKDIVVHVTNVSGSKAQISIEAPDDVEIIRTELLGQYVHRQNGDG